MIKRGDIYYIKRTALYPDSETMTDTPAVVVSSDDINEGERVQIVYLTNNPKQKSNTHVSISFFDKPSYALCENIRTCPVNKIASYIGRCTEEELEEIDKALIISLGIKVNQEQPVIVNEVTNEFCDEKDYILKLEAEKDTYKNLYENLLERILKG